MNRLFLNSSWCIIKIKKNLSINNIYLRLRFSMGGVLVNLFIFFILFGFCLDFI